ncbi:hypothetical protein KCMC57_up58030 [Kitasatospora sp. CMC57]|uniref:Nickel/cobalt efflux system n=1 Tax=Kitasatospora sp. CMC57 TaxID=3231513 RepID=A0AB33K1N5_9ACTN
MRAPGTRAGHAHGPGPVAPDDTPGQERMSLSRGSPHRQRPDHWASAGLTGRRLLPVLFAARMCLFDTIDGTFTNFAYGWACADPLRKVRYNLAVTGLSVAVALVIGTVELLALHADRLFLGGRFWDPVSGST